MQSCLSVQHLLSKQSHLVPFLVIFRFQHQETEPFSHISNNVLTKIMVFLFNFRKLKSCLPAMIRSLLFVLGFHKIRIKGKLASPSEAPLTVIAPHSSFLDILLLCEYGSAPSGVSKIENLQSPILGCKSVSVITIILVVFTIGRSVRLKSCYVVLNQKLYFVSY